MGVSLRRFSLNMSVYSRGQLFVLGCARVRRVAQGSVVSQ